MYRVISVEEHIDNLLSEVARLSKLDASEPIAVAYYVNTAEDITRDVHNDLNEYFEIVLDEDNYVEATKDNTFARDILTSWANLTNDKDEVMYDYVCDANGFFSDMMDKAKERYREVLEYHMDIDVDADEDEED